MRHGGASNGSRTPDNREIIRELRASADRIFDVVNGDLRESGRAKRTARARREGDGRQAVYCVRRLEERHAATWARVCVRLPRRRRFRRPARSGSAIHARDRRDAAQPGAGRLAPLAAHATTAGATARSIRSTARMSAQLQLAWSWAMQPGNQQATPLVHDGVMYLANPGSAVQALDAATGDLMWEYRREFPGGDPSASASSARYAG